MQSGLCVHVWGCEILAPPHTLHVVQHNAHSRFSLGFIKFIAARSVVVTYSCVNLTIQSTTYTNTPRMLEYLLRVFFVEINLQNYEINILF